MPRNRQVVFAGSMVGREQLTGLEFNPVYFFSGCRICGAVYQEEADRNPPADNDPERPAWLHNQNERHIAWRESENNKHPMGVRQRLALSGEWCTPEAALKLAPLGIFSLTDLVMSNEVSAALREAPRAPDEDAQTLTKKGL